METPDRLRRFLDLTASIATIASSVAILIVAVIVIRGGLHKPLTEKPAGNGEAVITKMDGIETAFSAATKRHDGTSLVLIEFSDFQCPFCGRYARETHAQVQRELVDTGRVDYVFRNFPLESIHPFAFKAAQATVCAGEQDNGWRMHDRLFADQKKLSVTDLLDDATSLGLDRAKFERCMAETAATQVQQDQAEGKKLGVRGTPTFLVGSIKPDGKTAVLRKVVGAQSLAVLKAAISEAASDAKKRTNE